MRTSSIVPWFLAIFVGCMAAACDKDDPVSGCHTETIVIGAGLERSEEPEGAPALTIQSVDFAANDTYRQAALDLIAVLDTLKVTVYGCSELMHTTGTCWPPYTVRIGFDPKEGESETIRAKLLETPVAGRLPVVERPDGYGVFFMTAGRGASDWWVLWYED